jgi:hypothetical protein
MAVQDEKPPHETPTRSVEYGLYLDNLMAPDDSGPMDRTPASPDSLFDASYSDSDEF